MKSLLATSRNYIPKEVAEEKDREAFISEMKKNPDSWGKKLYRNKGFCITVGRVFIYHNSGELIRSLYFHNGERKKQQITYAIGLIKHIGNHYIEIKYK
jgi:hypothetical protein